MWKRKWILLGIWLISLWIISNYGGSASYGLFFAITLIPFLSLVYCLCVFIRFRIYQKIESRDIICRQSVPYYFVLQNEDKYGFASVKARMFSTLSYVEDIPDDMEYELLPGDRYTYETKLVCRYRGEYEVGIKEVVVTDFFRLFTFKYKTTETIKALVKPRMIHLDELNSIQDIVAFVQKENQYADTEPDIVVRDYIAGDPVSQIHWKATAKEQKLKVRTRTGEDKQMICLFFETKRYGKDLLEYLPPENQILETTLALGLFLAERAISYTLLSQKTSAVSQTVGSLRDYEALYKSVSQTQFLQENDIQNELQSILHQSMTHHCKILFGVLSNLTTQILVQFDACLAQGTVVVLYVVTDENIDELKKQGNERLRIITVPVNAELRDIL
ncbi:MAG: DUF58 domain-containing protein [Clostridia bacterium]|mgnify:CR=1 FL=1|nr:DUF58 domain-containing protein [Clostridia bacterium]